MRKLFSTKKRIAAGVLAVAIIAATGGIAAAYFTTTGSGTGSTTAGANSGSITLHATIVGNILPGDGGQSVTFKADNSNTTTNLFVTTISFVSVTSSDTGCQSVLTGDPTEFSMAAVTSNSSVAPGAGHTIAGTGTLIWANSSSVDQTPCAGKSLTLNVSSN
jgi:hypothetical protein